MKEKTFYNILLSFNENPAKAKKKLDDKRLTLVEKKIVQGHLLLRDNKNSEVINLLLTQTPSELLFVESQRLLLLGCAYNNLSQFVQAQEYIIKSIEIVQNLNAPYFHFLGWFNYFWICANLNKLEEMSLSIETLSKLPISSKREQVRVLRCQFCFYQMSGRINEAELCMRSIDKVKEGLSESETIFYLIDKFMFYIQIEKFEFAMSTLEEMKKNRKFSLSENYQFMKLLLNNLVSGSVIYAYDADFKDAPVLLHQIRVIQALEARDNEQAKYFWDKLTHEFPGLYLDNFKYNGEKCLFSLCLDKHYTKMPSHTSFNFEEGLTKLDKLKIIFEREQNPISASNLFELIWGRSCESKDDLLKISKLIYRLKAEGEIQVEYKKGTYKVVSSSKIAS